MVHGKGDHHAKSEEALVKAYEDALIEAVVDPTAVVVYDLGRKGGDGRAIARAFVRISGMDCPVEYWAPRRR